MSKITRTSTLLSKARDEIAANGRTTGLLARRGRVCAIGGVYLAAGVDIKALDHKTDIMECELPNSTWPMESRKTAEKAIKLLDQVTEDRSPTVDDGFQLWLQWESIVEFNDAHRGPSGTAKVLAIFDEAIKRAKRAERAASRQAKVAA